VRPLCAFPHFGAFVRPSPSQRNAQRIFSVIHPLPVNSLFFADFAANPMIPFGFLLLAKIPGRVFARRDHPDFSEQARSTRCMSVQDLREHISKFVVY
jgi:hypothetical protein